MSRGIEVSLVVELRVMMTDGERVDWVQCLRKCRYRKSSEGSQEMGEWWTEKRAWGSWVSLLCTRMGMSSGLEFEETAPSTAAVADLGPTLG